MLLKNLKFVGTIDIFLLYLTYFSIIYAQDTYISLSFTCLSLIIYIYYIN